MIRVLHIIEHLAGGGGCVSPLQMAAAASYPGEEEHEFLSLGRVDDRLLATVPTLTIHSRGRRSYETISRWVMAAEFDIVHWHWWERMPFIGMLAGRLKQPSVITCDVFPSRSEYRLSTAELACADVVVFDGKDAFDAYPDLPRGRKEWIVGSTRLDAYNRRVDRSAPDHLIFGRGSALTSLKCPPGLIRDVAPILRAIPGAEFHIFGEGALSAALKRNIEKLGLGDRIRMRGWVSDFGDQVAQLDVYLYHLPWDSFASSELNLQGAAAAGLPIVLVPSEGTRWMFDHGIDALVAQDSNEACNYAVELARDPGRRMRLGKAARAKAERDWGIDLMAQNYRQRVYHPLLQRQNRTCPLYGRWSAPKTRVSAMRLARLSRRARRRIRDYWHWC